MVEPLGPGAAGMDIFTDIIESLLRPRGTRCTGLARPRSLSRGSLRCDGVLGLVTG